jgi:hypothetical protein
MALVLQVAAVVPFSPLIELVEVAGLRCEHSSATTSFLSHHRHTADRICCQGAPQ